MNSDRDTVIIVIRIITVGPTHTHTRTNASITAAPACASVQPVQTRAHARAIDDDRCAHVLPRARTQLPARGASVCAARVHTCASVAGAAGNADV